MEGKVRLRGLLLATSLAGAAAGANAHGAVVRLESPEAMSAPVTTIDFEGHPHLAPADTLFESRGVRFSRDDGHATVVYNPNSYEAHSGQNFLGTPSWQGASTWSTHLNAVFAAPVREVGAFFGNDSNGPGAFAGMTLSVFGPAGEPLGSVFVASNRNSHADQFIGLRSDVPFVRARFEHDAPDFGVGVDDVSFGAVPEPGAAAACAVVAGAFLLRRRGDGLGIDRGAGEGPPQ